MAISYGTLGVVRHGVWGRWAKVDIPVNAHCEIWVVRGEDDRVGLNERLFPICSLTHPAVLCHRRRWDLGPGCHRMKRHGWRLGGRMVESMNGSFMVVVSTYT